MLLFGHVGITAGAAHVLNRKFGYKLNIRRAAFLGVAPDLIDKPIGLLYPNVFDNHTRLLGHHALFCVVVLAAFLAFKKRMKYPLVYWGAYMSHIALDRIWHLSLPNFLWPLLGMPQGLDSNIPVRWYNALFDPYNACGEIAGLLILIYLTSSGALFGGARSSPPEPS